MKRCLTAALLVLGIAGLLAQAPAGQAPANQNPAPAPQAPGTPPVTKAADGGDCSFPDVENIGNRDINGRIYLFFPNFISYEREIQIGAEYAAQVQQSAKLLTIPEVTEYMDTLVQNLVRHSDAKVPFHVYLVDSDEVNAFALPGGYLFVNKGLLQAAETEDELVGVLCHEIAHVAARHATERLTKAELLQWASIPSIFVGGIGGIALRNAIGLALNLQILGITRGSEKEADILGSQYAWSAGFDPNGFVTFFEKLMAMEKKQPGKFASWFRTHPPTPERITYIQREIDYCLPVKPKYIVTSSSFDEVRGRLAIYDNTLLAANKPSAPGEKGKKEGKPTLKRRTDTDDEGGTDQKEPPAKPTLKKDEGEEDPAKT
jgi:predicted Zn-dependent protease